MELGAFSVSLAVKDLEGSRKFYAALGFEAMGGDAGQGWLILRSGKTVIGLFKGMFEGNLLTFNPGWSQDAQPLEGFEDIRAIEARLRAAGIEPEQGADPQGTGPASVMLRDPDGNAILLDQHVDRPA